MDLSFNTETIAKQISVKSAVNPILWACVGVSIPLYIISSLTAGYIAMGTFVIATGLVVVFAFSYLYLLFKNPNCLRSEDYQLKAEILKLLGDKDNPFHANAGHVISIVNNPRLPIPTGTQPDSLEQLPAPQESHE